MQCAPDTLDAKGTAGMANQKGAISVDPSGALDPVGDLLWPELCGLKELGLLQPLASRNFSALAACTGLACVGYRRQRFP